MIHELKLSGRLDLRLIRNGQVIQEMKGIPNLILNGGLTTTGDIDAVGERTFYTFTNATANYEDLPGTWSQVGNTVTRASGAGTFPSSPSQIGNELKWQDGERCHVLTRVSDTEITVSGPARTLTGKTIRRYGTNFNSISGNSQSKATTSTPVAVRDDTAGTYTRTWSVIMDAATAAYSLNSVALFASNMKARIVLPAPVAVEEFDQLEMSYTVQANTTGRGETVMPISDVFTGWPYRFPVATIVGNGSTFDIVTSENHNFLAGDQIELVDVIPLRKTITSITASGSAWTVTAAGHGLNVADTVEIENCTVAGYNGTHTVASVVDANNITITNAATPGSATDGTVRLATPVTYFNGAWTVASIPDATTIRVTSDRTGPAVDTSSRVRGKDEMAMHINGVTAGQGLVAGRNRMTVADGNELVPPAFDSVTIPPSGTTVFTVGGAATSTNAAYTNDWTTTHTPTSGQSWSAGGSDVPRVRQFKMTATTSIALHWVFTLTTPQPKLATHRLAFPALHLKVTRELP